MKRYFFTALIFLPTVVLIRAQEPTHKVVSARLAGEHTVSNGGGRIIQGDVQITFEDGRTEVITHAGKCVAPEVSKNGAVYWTHCAGINERVYPLNEKLFSAIHKAMPSTSKENRGTPFCEILPLARTGVVW